MRNRITHTMLPAFGLMVLLLGIVMIPVFTGGAQDGLSNNPLYTLPRDQDMELQVMTELNRWRLRLGLYPLHRNPVLDELAMLQASYVAPQIPFTTLEVDFHTDQFGNGIAPRAQSAGWASYGFNEIEFVSEIAAYYPTLQGVIGFWQTSPVHRASATNNGFREMGVAVLRYREWILAYVVLGSRPNVLPVNWHPASNSLYLTMDESGFSDIAFEPTQLQIINAYGERMHEPEWLVWAKQVPVPPGSTSLLNVIVSDGIIDIETVVDLSTANILPYDPIPAPTATPSPYPTRTPTITPVFTYTAMPPTPTTTPTPQPRSFDTGYDIVLTYDNIGLTLINASGGPLNMAPLAFVSSALGLNFSSAFVGRYAEESLNRFPANHCMQMWSFRLRQNPPPLPPQCSLLASGRSILRPGERFWLADEFVVTYNRAIIATCHAEDRGCAFDLPRLGDE